MQLLINHTDITYKLEHLFSVLDKGLTQYFSGVPRTHQASWVLSALRNRRATQLRETAVQPEAVCLAFWFSYVDWMSAAQSANAI